MPLPRNYNLLGFKILCVVSFFFFFFQAEDGIRDLTVTGVQTCALPICEEIGSGGIVRDQKLHDKAILAVRESVASVGLEYLGVRPSHLLGAEGNQEYRSEERRVGKECRSRWSPYH